MPAIITQVVSGTAGTGLAQATALLKAGELVAAATETVYGLAADARNDDAVKKIYAAKGRPSNNPLICHVSEQDMADSITQFNGFAHRLADAFWPGPLTMVLPAAKNNGIAKTVSAGLSTLAVRCPAHPVMHGLIEAFDGPIAAPSANMSGKLSPTSAQAVLESLGGKVKLILDGGETQVGLESTIVRIEDDRVQILRPGSITADMLEETLGQAVEYFNGTTILAPGQLQSHYAPNAPLRLNATEAQKGEILIGYADIEGDIMLSQSGDLDEAAHTLFRALRKADQTGKPIAVAPIPETGIGIAINDRLRRAAAPRSPK